MSELTLDTLKTIMKQCAGADESIDLAGDIGDTPFAELGYDSIALLETAGRIQREYGIRLDDEVVAEAQTPRDFLDLVNKAIADSGG